MKTKQIIALVLTIVAGTALGLVVYQTFEPAFAAAESSGHDHGHAHDSAPGHEDTHSGNHDEMFARGPHGGRLLEDANFSLEITMAEAGGAPPRLQIYPAQKGHPVAPAEVELTVQLIRLGSPVETVTFRPEADHLRSEQIIKEPHSFAVRVTARHAANNHEWAYESFEGRTELSPAMVDEAGLAIATAGSREIRETVRTYGRLAPNEDRMAYVIPRFPGKVLETRKKLGDTVAEGEMMARVESNDSLQTYDITSPLAGTVIEKNVSAGELTHSDQAIYTVANLETVWVDLHVYPRDFARVRLGQRAIVAVGPDWPPQEGVISYLSPFGAEPSQTILARLELKNEEGFLRPGLFVSAQIEVNRVSVPVAVPDSALQTFRDWDVVFIREGDIFEVRPVTLGRRDDAWVEILDGLAPGQSYVSENSFLIKADILKSGAAHDH